MYDYVIVGAGIYGATFAFLARQAGKRVLVVEKRSHIGGNCYTECMEDINVHKYGAHIFHTSNKAVWDFIRQFANFNHYVNSPVASYKGKLYNLPFNMNTFYQLWGVRTPAEAAAKIEEQRKEYSHIREAANLEEQALMLAGHDIYQTLIKGYSEKQWGMEACDIPAFVIRRVPFRFTFNNNYFNDPYQGIPVGGYTQIVEKMLEGIEVRLNTDFLTNRNEYKSLAPKILFTGQIDAYFDYCYGALDYRSLKFEHIILEDTDNYQGNAVFNYTDIDVPYTRIIEHKHFEFGTQPGTVITKEYPAPWTRGAEPFYPVNDDKNQRLFERYKELGDAEEGVLFGGRLGEYKYYDMDKVVESVLSIKDRI